MSPGRRRLTATEIELWLAVTTSVTPRDGAALPAPPPAPPPALPPSAPRPGGARERKAPFLPPYVPPAQVRKGAPPLAPLEKRYRQKVVRGRVEIDGAIDLHGMSQPQAHAALAGFLRSAAGDGARLVLVVTGKGRVRLAPGDRTEIETGVLRRAVPGWLRADDLRPIVMGFEEAGLPHGGLGALYVRLRRRRG